MSSARLSYRERRAQARAFRPGPSPDEIDDRQVDAIEFGWESVDDFIANGLDPDVAAKAIEGWPPRLPKVPKA